MNRIVAALVAGVMVVAGAGSASAQDSRDIMGFGPNFFGGNNVFAPNLFARHAPDKTANDDPDRNSGVSDHGIAVADHRVNRDPIVGYHCLLRCVSRG